MKSNLNDLKEGKDEAFDIAEREKLIYLTNQTQGEICEDLHNSIEKPIFRYFTKQINAHENLNEHQSYRKALFLPNQYNELKVKR